MLQVPIPWDYGPVPLISDKPPISTFNKMANVLDVLKKMPCSYIGLSGELDDFFNPKDRSKGACDLYDRSFFYFSDLDVGHD